MISVPLAMKVTMHYLLYLFAQVGMGKHDSLGYPVSPPCTDNGNILTLTSQQLSRLVPGNALPSR